MTIEFIESPEEFATLLVENPDVVVSFTADWCRFCKALSPLLEELAEQHPDVTFRKINSDAAADLVSAFGVQTIPHTRRFTKTDEGLQELPPVVGAVPRAKVIKDLGF